MTVSGGADEDRIKSLEARVGELEKYRSWLTGLFAALLVMGALLLDKAKLVMGLSK